MGARKTVSDAQSFQLGAHVRMPCRTCASGGMILLGYESRNGFGPALSYQ